MAKNSRKHHFGRKKRRSNSAGGRTCKLETVAQDYYSGQKESEKPKVQKVFKWSGLAGQKTTFDALPLNPKTLKMITHAKVNMWLD